MQQLQPWRESYCGCFGDCGSCCLGCCCPCIQYGMNVERLEGPGSSCVGHCCLYYICLQIGCCCCVHGPKRTQLRAKFGLVENCSNDCCATCFCPCLAMTQEWREMVARDPPKTMTMGSPVVITQGQPQPQTVVMPPQNYQSGQQGYQYS